jgi:hypothetical protein
MSYLFDETGSLHKPRELIKGNRFAEIVGVCCNSTALVAYELCISYELFHLF